MRIEEIIINEGYKDINPVSFGSEKCRKCWFYGPAVREYWLLHYVVSGFGTFERDGNTYKIEPGDFFVIPPFLETYYEADKEKPWHYIWIGFTTEQKLPEPFFNPVVKCAGAGEIFADMLTCQNMDSGKSAFLASCIWRLISLLLETKTEKTDYIEKALNCIHSEYMNDIDITAIAHRLNLDRSYFTVLFSKKVGIPPGQYLLNVRLEKASELMLLHNESPTSAATSCGFADIYHFSKAFKKKYGLSPRQYKSSKL